MTARCLLGIFARTFGISLISIAIAGAAIAGGETQNSVAPIGETRLAANQAARARNDASTWITLQDYPSDTRHEGATRYRLLIATTGPVALCEITESSGSRWLDEATCRNLVRRARFYPATNSQGEAIEGRYEGMMRWHIPDQGSKRRDVLHFPVSREGGGPSPDGASGTTGGRWAAACAGEWVCEATLGNPPHPAL